MAFYTVFLGFTGAAMGWSLQQRASHQTEIHILAAIFGLQSLFTMITSFRMARYSRQAGLDYEWLEKSLLNSPNLPEVLGKTNVIPAKLAQYAGYTNTFAMFCTIVGWIAIAV